MNLKMYASIALCSLLGACASQTQLGTGGSLVSGSAGSAGTQDAHVSLRHCDRPIGTAALIEPQNSAQSLLTAVGLQSPVPLLRLMMAQSNCFQVIDRGAALYNIQQEDALKQGGFLREGSQTARGNLVATQFLITPNVVFSNPNAGGASAGASLGGLLGGWGALAGAIVGGMRIQEAQTTLFLTDAQSGVQVGVVEGSARARDFGGAGGLLGFGGGLAGLGGIGGYGNTAEGKLIAAAFLDAHNKLVDQARAVAPRPPAEAAAQARPR